jgi:membrane-bound metal-dependent hydrolase YbcI (DUF457 family)
MMGRSHALSGALAFAGVSLVYPLSPAELVIGAAVTTGAALLPDIDHPQATVSNTFGPITRVFSWAIRTLAGGHRVGTHSIAGIAALALLAQAGVNLRHSTTGRVILSVVLILALSGVVRLFKIPGYLDDFLPVPIAAGIVCFTSIPLAVVPPALALGCSIHVLGDMLTKQKIPIFWPVSDTGYALKFFKAGGPMENLIVVPAMVLGIGWTLWLHVSRWWGA